MRWKKLRGFRILFYLIIGIFLWAGARIHLQPADAITVPPLYRFNVNAVEVFFSEEDILAGEEIADGRMVKKPGAVTATMAINTPSALGIFAASETFQGPGDGIPVSRLEWRIPGGEWTPLSTDVQQIVIVPAPGIRHITLDFRLAVYYTDPVGEYEVEIKLAPDLL